MIEPQLGQLLVDAGVITSAQLQQALARQVQVGEKRVQNELYGLALQHERKLCEELSRRAGTPALVLTESTLHLRALDFVPEPLANQFGILAVDFDAETLTVVGANAIAPYLTDQIAMVTGRRVVAAVAVAPVLRDAIAGAYAARGRNENVLRGGKSGSAEPALIFARNADAAKVDDAMALARTLQQNAGRAGPFGAPQATAVGAIKLKQVAVPRPAAPAAQPPAQASSGAGFFANATSSSPLQPARPIAHLQAAPMAPALGTPLQQGMPAVQPGATQAMGTPMSLHAPIAQLPQAMGTPLPQAAPAAQGMAQAPLGVPTRRPTPMPGLATPLGPGSPPKRSTSSASMLRPITGGVPTPQAGVIAKPAPVAVIVEDDDEIRMLLRRVLTHDGLQVIEARAGDEGANILRQTRPDIVILDAMLPKLHGFEICAGIKRSEIFRGVPVVMISAVYKGFEQAREIQEVHGADAFVEKPFEVHFVRKLVAGLLHRKLERAAPPPDRAAQIEEARAAIDALYGASQWQQAAQHVDRWLGLDPFDARAWLERGNLLAQQGDLVRALGSYEYAAVYEPEMFAAHMNLSIVYEQLGFAKRAKETWARARDLAPDPMTRQKIEAHLGRAS